MSRRIIGARSDISHDRFRKSVRGAASNGLGKSRNRLRYTGETKHMTAQTQQVPMRKALIRLGEHNGVELAVIPRMEKTGGGVIISANTLGLVGVAAMTVCLIIR